MVAGKDANPIVEKRDLIHIIILLAVALGIGIYLIATTVLIAKDGVLYIEQAQKFSSNPVGIIKARPSGYPFLIFIDHKLVTLLGCGTSVSTWIYCAQSVSLVCRLLAIILLYFIGKILVGSKKSFWAVLILIMLPYPARFGSDVLRDWPHILFLATGFLFLLWGAKHGKCWMFAVAGLAAGLGHTIRAECAQIVIYGILWLLISLFLPRPNISRLKAVCLILVLLIGFAIPAAPYMKIRQRVLPPKLKSLISCNTPWQSGGLEQNGFNCGTETYAASAMSTDVLNALIRLAQEISDDLFYFFVPALVIGIYARLCRQSEATSIEKFFISAFIVLNIIMLILLYCNHGYISRRHAFPLIVFTIFYVAIGLQELANRLSSISYRFKWGTNQSPQVWFFILLSIGGIICLPKLFRPTRIDKKIYKTAANWLKQNTAQEDLIAVPDRRISFYAERKGIIYDDKTPKRARFIVKILKEAEDSVIEEELPGIKKCFSVADKGGKRILVYDISHCINDRVSFVGYKCTKIAEEKYRFTFSFEVHKNIEKDWRIYVHAAVTDENVPLLPENRRKHKFDNWDSQPVPPTSQWSVNQRITISREVSAKPIPYYLTLGFYLPEEGRYGRQIHLSWVDLGNR